jgi:TIR domain
LIDAGNHQTAPAVSSLPSGPNGKRWFVAPLGLRTFGVAYNGIGFTPDVSGDLSTYYIDEADLPTDGLEHDLVITFESPDPQFYSCFISYSSKDDEFARRLHTDLKDASVECSFAPEDMKIGDRIRTWIDEVIRLRQKLLLVLSENSIDSAWVEQEVETALEKERETGSTVLFPIRLDDAVMESKSGWAAHIRRTRHIGDFSRWRDQGAYQEALERLLRDLRADR